MKFPIIHKDSTIIDAEGKEIFLSKVATTSGTCRKGWSDVAEENTKEIIFRANMYDMLRESLLRATNILESYISEGYGQEEAQNVIQEFEMVLLNSKKREFNGE